MTARAIVQVGTKDFHTAIYVGVDDGARYVVSTDNLCPDCTTPMIVLADGGALLGFHDGECVAAQAGVDAVSESDRQTVVEIRRRFVAESGDSGLS